MTVAQPLAQGAPTAGWGIAAARRLVAVPLPGLVGELSALLAEVLPVAGPVVVGVLTGDCMRAPLKVAGGDGLASRITSTEMARLAERATPGQAWVGTAQLAGEDRRAVVVAASPEGAAGSLFAVPVGDLEPTAAQLELIDGLCQVAALSWTEHAVRADPEPVATSLAVQQERARAVVELGDEHEATLSALLAALRARGVSDQAARAAATDVAVAALIDLRERGDRDRSLTEEQAGTAFERLREQLAPITRHAAAQLELAGPGPTATDGATGAAAVDLPTGGVPAAIVADADRFIPADIAHAARATSRGVALVLLDQPQVGRLRLAWQLGPRSLVVTARDDGPGDLPAGAFAAHRVEERLHALGGSIAVDAVPGWGTTVTATLPLAAPEPAAESAGPLALLGARELEVLAELVKGSRNAEIAEALTITPHTVKFHVANILRKLGARSRGEAAAIARQHGVGPTP